VFKPAFDSFVYTKFHFWGMKNEFLTMKSFSFPVRSTAETVIFKLKFLNRIKKLKGFNYLVFNNK
jgi:hypothetical protein